MLRVPQPRLFSRHFAERRRWLPAFDLITPHVLLTRAPFEKSLESGMRVTYYNGIFLLGTLGIAPNVGSQFGGPAKWSPGAGA